MCISKLGNESSGGRDGSSYNSGARQRCSNGVVDQSNRQVGLGCRQQFGAGQRQGMHATSGSGTEGVLTKRP
ncbi:hypothetical protein ACFX15_042863 [Malus domestica]